MKNPSPAFGIITTPNNSITSSEQEFNNLHACSSPNPQNCTQKKFSQSLNKHSTKGFSNFKVSNNLLEEGLL